MELIEGLFAISLIIFGFVLGYCYSQYREVEKINKECEELLKKSMMKSEIQGWIDIAIREKENLDKK
jgi:hypothetical protein